jgi:hypothetical protein
MLPPGHDLVTGVRSNRTVRLAPEQISSIGPADTYACGEAGQALWGVYA